MDSENSLPYDGDLQVALELGDDIAVAQIMYWRDSADVSFGLPRLDEKKRICEVEIFFLDKNGQVYNNFCGKLSMLVKNVASSNISYIVNIPIKNLTTEVYILEDDVNILKNNSKIVAIPLYKQQVYTLADKSDYDEDYANLYYGVYTRIFWTLKNRSADWSYEHFKSLPESNMLKEIRALIKK
tara:strand:+ start:147 stop:698 length:552 start_codon:yes stop_codon:yes gene_type:complete